MYDKTWTQADKLNAILSTVIAEMTHRGGPSQINEHMARNVVSDADGCRYEVVITRMERRTADQGL